MDSQLVFVHKVRATALGGEAAARWVPTSGRWVPTSGRWVPTGEVQVGTY